jgi:fucose permease
MAPLVPDIKARFNLDESSLGLVLLCLGLGSILVMPFGGGLAGRFGCKKVIFAASLVFLGSLPFLASTQSLPGIVLAMLALGAGGGMLDVVMNIQAVMVEEDSRRPMMSGFHGMFSVGGIAGAGGSSLLLGARISTVMTQSIIAIVCLVVLLSATPFLLSYGRTSEHKEATKAFTFPRGQVLLLGILCFIVFMAEGSVLDWGGLLLKNRFGVESAQAGYGYVSFAAMMTLNRLLGDRIVAALGRSQMVLLGSICGASGFVLAATVPIWWIAVIGFGMVGIGLANVVPILFSAAGRQTDMPGNQALSSVTTMGYVGLLCGPPLLGFIARQTSLIVSMGFLAVLCVLVSLSFRRVGSETN